MTTPNLAERVRVDFLRHAGAIDIERVTPREAIVLMASFAREVPYETDGSTPYDDTLLFEYGVYDFGRGEHFRLSTSRQVIFPIGDNSDADDFIIQISLRFEYPSDTFRLLPSMTKWGCLLPSESAMEDFAFASPGYLLASRIVPRSVRLVSSAQ